MKNFYNTDKYFLLLFVSKVSSQGKGIIVLENIV